MVHIDTSLASADGQARPIASYGLCSVSVSVFKSTVEVEPAG